MKRTSNLFHAYARHVHDKPSDHLDAVTPEDTLCLAGATGDKERFHAPLETPGLDAYVDYKDRLHWQEGRYLHNAALILTLKKGRDHVSDIGRHGELLSAAEKAQKPKWAA